MNTMVRTARTYRSARSTRADSLGVVTVPAWIPDFVPLIHKDDAVRDLEIRMTNWDGARQGYRLEIYWDGTAPANKVQGVFYDISATDWQNPDPNFYYTLTVPYDPTAQPFLMSEGTHTIWYSATTLGSVTSFSEPVSVRVDLTAPGLQLLPAPRFSTQIEASNLISETDIQDFPAPISLRGVVGLVAGYSGLERGDTITPVIDTTKLTSGSAYLPTDTPPDYIDIYYSEADLLALTPGPHEFGYEVVDISGNATTTLPNTASMRELNVEIAPPPANLVPPTVVEFVDHGLVTYADAQAGVHVEIAPYTNPSTNHSIAIVWGNQTTNRVAITDINADPILEVQLDYQTIRDAQLLDIASINVSYRLYGRGGVEIVPPSPSGPTTVQVDLSTPGGENPDEPDDVHGNLRPLTIYGGVDNVADVISDADLQVDAIARIPFFSVDSLHTLQLDDRLTLQWGAQPPVTLAAVTASEDLNKPPFITRPVPALTMRNEGGGTAIPVYYRVTRDLSVPPNTSTSRAPDKDVEVQSSSDHPGGGTLPQPIFTTLNDRDVIGPNELLAYQPLPGHYNPVRIPLTGVSNLAPGDTVWIAFRGFDELTGGNEIPTAAFLSPPFPLTLKELQTDGFYDVLVPERYHYAICVSGRAEAQSFARNSKGVSNSPNYSYAFCDVKCPKWGTCGNWETDPPCRD